MFIIDGHQDIAYNVLGFGRDFTQAVAATRASEGQRAKDIATLGLPDALAGGVGLVFGTLYVAPASAKFPGTAGYRTADEAYQQAQAQLAIYRRLAQHPQISLVHSQADLAALQASWQAGVPRLGIVLLMEGADPIRSPDEVAAWFAAGVRLVGLAWGQTRASGGTGAPGPLTDEGRALLPALRQAGCVVDLSHSAEQSFWETLERFDGPLIASHSNCRALVPGPSDDRHLSDAMIKALIERGGVIGTVLFNRFLASSWAPADGKAAVPLTVVVRHIDHICQLAGNSRHVAIGSDFDGGFGCEAIPAELDTVGDLRLIGTALQGAGYSAADVAAVLGGNWLRVLAGALPAV